MSAATGSVLCTICIRQLESNLSQLPFLHQQCLVKTSSQFKTIHHARISGGSGRDAVDASALDSRDDMLAVLTSWSELVTEGLHITAPARSVPCLAGFLGFNLPWLIKQHPAVDFADEVEEIRARAIRIVDPGHDTRPRPVGRCVMDDCAGTISILPQDAAASWHNSVRCSMGHSWEINEWLVICSLMERQEKDQS